MRSLRLKNVVIGELGIEGWLRETWFYIIGVNDRAGHYVSAYGDGYPGSDECKRVGD
jgi:hypothetical protein